MKRRPWILILLITGVALDLLISLALGSVALEARHNAAQARIIKLAAYEYCLNSNQAKQADLERWDAVLTLLKDGNNDPKLETFITGVERANQSADSTVDCNKINPAGK